MKNFRKIFLWIRSPPIACSKIAISHVLSLESMNWRLEWKEGLEAKSNLKWLLSSPRRAIGAIFQMEVETKSAA
jgi:hypothetical protein